MCSFKATSAYDYLILGAGPAGLQLAYYLHKKRRSYLVLEAGESPGTFFKRFPRHRRLISINKPITGVADPETNLRWDWNSLITEKYDPSFTTYSQDYFPNADAYVRYLCDFAQRFELKIEFQTRVTQIRRRGDFLVESQTGGLFSARRLIVATGRAQPYIPEILGIEHCERYEDCSTNPSDYKNQRVMVIGKGNSGMETADNLVGVTSVIHLLSPSPVRLAWKTHYVGDLRAVNNNILDTYQLKSQNTIIDARINRIEKLPDGRLRVSLKYSHADNHWDEVLVDRAIVCTGFQFDRSIFERTTCFPQISPCGKFPMMNSQWESTNIPDMYFAGALMHVRDYRKSFSGFIHGFRYNIRFLQELFEKKYEGGSLECETLALEIGEIVRFVIGRVTTASSLFQQPAFLCDLLLLDTTKREVLCYRDIPVDYIKDDGRFANMPRLQVTLEYGHFSETVDPFSIFRYPSDGKTSAFIHPVIRYFEGHNSAAEHHIPEDLENQWDNQRYIAPFVNFLTEQLSPLLTGKRDTGIKSGACGNF